MAGMGRRWRSERVGAVLVLLLGVLIAYLCMSRQLYSFVRPSFLPWMALSAGTMIMLSLWELAEPADGHGHAHLPRVAGMLLVPVLLFVVFRPSPLGQFTVDTGVASQQQRATGPLPELHDGVNELTLETLTRIWLHDKGALKGRSVRVVGFAAPTAGDPTQRTLNRVKIWCCAADALPYTVRLADPRGFVVDDWYDVVGHVDLAASTDVVPVLVVERSVPVPVPQRPYL